MFSHFLFYWGELEELVMQCEVVLIVERCSVTPFCTCFGFCLLLRDIGSLTFTPYLSLISIQQE